MVLHFFRISIMVLLAALSGQLLAASENETSHCTSAPVLDADTSEHHTPDSMSGMTEEQSHADHSMCCEQTCACPPGVCGQAVFIYGNTPLTFSPDTRKHRLPLRFTLTSIPIGALYRPPITV